MSEEEKNLEAKLNAKIEETNAELKELRARLYDQFNQNWREIATERERNELSKLYEKRPKLEQEIQIAEERFKLYEGNEKVEEMNNIIYYKGKKIELEGKIKELEERINKINQTKYYY